MDRNNLARAARRHLAHLILAAIAAAERDGLNTAEIIDVLDDVIDAVASTAELAGGPHVIH